MTRPLEYCAQCEEPTGHAGAGDGSLYTDEGEGPYCDRCYHERVPDDEPKP